MLLNPVMVGLTADKTVLADSTTIATQQVATTQLSLTVDDILHSSSFEESKGGISTVPLAPKRISITREIWIVLDELKLSLRHTITSQGPETLQTTYKPLLIYTIAHAH